jgi:hypothetical protein
MVVMDHRVMRTYFLINVEVHSEIQIMSCIAVFSLQAME